MNRSGIARIAIASAAVGTAVGLGALAARRRGSPGVPAAERAPRRSPEWLRAFVTERFNPAVVRLGLVGGRRSPWCYVEHVGRHSGTVYRTPVLPIRVGSHVYIPLPYGVDVNWARNVRAAGHCRMQRHDQVLALDEPAVIAAGDHPGIPGWYRAVLERRGNRYLRLHVLTTVPGRLDGAPAPAPARAASPEPAAATTPRG
jgi:hypothetical protein